MHQALLPDGGQPVQQDRGGGHQGSKLEAWSTWARSRIRAAAPTSSHPQVRPGVGDQPPGRRAIDADRHRSGARTSSTPGRWCDAQGPGRRFAVHQDPPEVQPTCMSTRRSTRIRRSARAWRCSTSARTWQALQVMPIAEWAKIGTTAPSAWCSPSTTRGDEVWFSVWSAKDKESALVVVGRQDAEAEDRDQGPALITPTGKFNVLEHPARRVLRAVGQWGA
jgi:hypothetical protein